MIPLAQNPPSKLKFFFLFSTLNSSLAQSAAELWPAKVCPGFLAHNFGYRYASKSIKGSIDADFDLVFKKTLSQKNRSIG